MPVIEIKFEHNGRKIRGKPVYIDDDVMILAYRVNGQIKLERVILNRRKWIKRFIEQYL